MNQPDDILYLPAERLTGLSDALSGLTLGLEWAEDRGSFAILDCFDQRLRRTSRLLLRQDDRLVLFTAEGTVLEQPALGDARFVADFADGPVKAALADLSPLRALLDVTRGGIRNGRLALIDDEGKTHARADLRLLELDGGRSVVLAAPHGLRGYDKALRQLTDHLRDCGAGPLTDGGLYQAIDPDRIDYIAKPAVVIGHDETAFSAANDLISNYIAVARANEDGIVADHDTEFLHDYRVALRKIRSVLSLFRGVYHQQQTEMLKTRFSRLMAPTGRLRDLDVYLLEKQHYFDLLPASLHTGVERMFDLIGAEREAEQARLTKHLQGARYGKEIAALADLFERREKLRHGENAGRSSHDLASELIWKRYRKICKTAAALTADSPDVEVHALRIQCKKLRYLMEFFGPVFPAKPFNSLLKPLKQLQESLGLFNDYGVQQISLQGFMDKLQAEPQGLEVAQSVGALIAVLHQRQLEERARIGAAFDQFYSEHTQRTFRALFHDGKE